MSDELKAFLEDQAKELADVVFLDFLRMGLAREKKFPGSGNLPEDQTTYYVTFAARKFLEKLQKIGLPIPEGLEL